MNISKKILLIVGLFGLCAARPAAALDDDVKDALTQAKTRTVTTAVIWGPICDLLGKGLDKFLPGLGKLVKPVFFVGDVCLGLQKLKTLKTAYEQKGYELSTLPDVDDKKLLTICKKALGDSGAQNADKLQIKLDVNYSPWIRNGHTYPSVFMTVPIVIINAVALRDTKNSTALHETGHLADTTNCTMRHISDLVIVPLGVMWVVRPAAKKITEYLCEPILQSAVDSSVALTEQVTGSKKIAQGMQTSLSLVKEAVKLGCVVGIVFVSCVGLKTLNSALLKREEKFADNFACKNLSIPSEFLAEANNYHGGAVWEKLEQQLHPVLSWINSMFNEHPSRKSRAKKFLVHAGSALLKKGLTGSCDGISQNVHHGLDAMIKKVQ